MRARTLKLLDIASGGLSKDSPPGLPPYAPKGSLSRELLELLSHRNGFLAFESALHVFPCIASATCMTLGQWNDPLLWRNTYEHLATHQFFFAQDVFGNQFSISDDKDGIGRFDAETGETEEFSQSLEEWSKRLLDEYDVETGYPLAHEWQTAHGPLSLDWRLVPKVPFVLGGEYELENLVSKPAVEGMRLRGQLATQLQKIPDGTKVQFRVIE